MFRQLFGGGSARFELVPTESGEIDLLESGIEIRATSRKASSCAFSTPAAKKP